MKRNSAIFVNRMKNKTIETKRIEVFRTINSTLISTVLASSGIDYDIKLWTPSAKEPMEPKDKDEVCVRFFFLPLYNDEERIQ